MIELEKALHAQKEHWKEKSRIKWHHEGDKNTKFFHQISKVRQVTKHISVLKVGEELISGAQLEQHEFPTIEICLI